MKFTNAEYLPARFIGPLRELEISHEECLVAARGILGECGPYASEEEASACLWAILRRCLLLPNTKTYSEMWAAFSQPINQAWQGDGKFCREGGRYHDRDECSPARISRREKIANLPWDKIPTQIAGYALAFGMGLLYAPVITEIKQVRISNWASYPGVEEKFPWGIDIMGNWFFEDTNLLDGSIQILVQH